MRLVPAALFAAVAMIAALGGCADVRDRDAAAQGLDRPECTRCHGGVDNRTGAPPFDLQGRVETTAISVGQHTAHVSAGVACSSCHPDRPVVQAPGHLDGKVDVALQGLAAKDSPGAAFNPATGTCSGVYCHGATLNAGGLTPTPLWTQAFAANRCAQCHGSPPPPPHPQQPQCGICHGETVGPDGTLIAGGKHVNGAVEVVGGHGPGYADPASPAFHGPDAIRHLAGQAGALDCRSCHGADFNGTSVAPSCTQCHQSAGWVNPAWPANCTFCHGTRNKTFAFPAQLNQSAPPEAVLNGETTGPRVGAHRKHLSGGTYTTGYACATCHAVPAQATSLAHINGVAAVALAGQGSFLPGRPNLGTFTPGATRDVPGTCATYCHQPVGTQAGAVATPSWGGTPLACNACHQNPPNTGMHPGSPRSVTLGDPHGGFTCSGCHLGIAAGGDTLLDRALHANGVNNVNLASGTFDPNAKTCSTAGCHGDPAPFPWNP